MIHVGRLKLKVKKKAVKQWSVIVGSVVVLVGVFYLGVNFGNGRISFSQFSSLNNGLPAKLNYASVTQVYNELRDNYDGTLSETKLLDGMKEGMVNAAGDPYTEYFNASDTQDFNNQLSGSFSGIGAELGQDSKGDLEIISPINGTPASKAGLQAQDIITSINGASTTGMSVDDAVDKIRGQEDTKVTLGVLRNGQNLTFSITRENITVPSVTSQVIDGDIGYMQISEFSDDTSQLAQQAAQTFKNDNVKGIILDLRGNPGGLLTAAVNVSSLWLPGGDTILQEKRGSTIISTETATGNDILHGIPTAVLIDQGSASASEITAGALHDDGAATLFGVKSFGKGSVQQVIPLTDGTEMKVTIAKWYRPDGQNINKVGITPDHVVTMSTADVQSGNDTQKAAALQFLEQK